eukprot:1180997-Prorocentrum_minimum.AAC.3
MATLSLNNAGVKSGLRVPSTGAHAVNRVVLPRCAFGKRSGGARWISREMSVRAEAQSTEAAKSGPISDEMAADLRERTQGSLVSQVGSCLCVGVGFCVFATCSIQLPRISYGR